MKRNTTPKTCHACGASIDPRFNLHKECLDRVRASFPYRQHALTRDGFVCAKCPDWWNRTALRTCQAVGVRRRVEVDHIVPLAALGANAPQNLQVLCRRAHRKKTRRDIAELRGTAARFNRARILTGVALTLLLLTVWEAYGSPGRGHALPIGIVAVLLTAAFTFWATLRKRTMTRLTTAVCHVTGDSVTKRRIIRARHWRWSRTDGLRLPRLAPTDIEVRYPHTFADHLPARQAELEDRVATKFGGTWYCQWNPPADRVRMRTPDPLAAMDGVAWPNAEASRLSIWDPIPVGLGVDGQPVTVDAVYSNLLIAGEPGSGKSVAQSMFTATAALDPNVVLHGIDGKGLVELGGWKDSMDNLCGNSHKDAIDLLQELRGIMDLRFQMLFESGVRKIERGDGNSVHVLIVDELALFTAGGSKTDREKFTDALRDIVSRGRAAGIVVVAATQRPSATVVPTDLRDLIGYRWAFRCSTPASSDMILGAGQSSLGFSAARVAASTRGVGFLLAEGSTPTRLRSYRIDDPALARLASRAARLRGPAAPLSPVVLGVQDRPEPSTSP